MTRKDFSGVKRGGEGGLGGVSISDIRCKKGDARSEEQTAEVKSHHNIVGRPLHEKKERHLPLHQEYNPIL